MPSEVKKHFLKDLSPLVSLCKQRGFVYPSSEIYGGLNSCWDYGPLGSQLKTNIKRAWWKAMTFKQNIVGLDASILMHPTVWKASGHVDGFSDPLVDCRSCKNRFREDHGLKNGTVTCPKCDSTDITESREFNLMFQTHMGPILDESSKIYLRPETAQGIFVNFENVQKSTRKKIPFGIAQIGKSFRNEITPGNFIFRTREFEQMEMQFFVTPGTDDEHFEFWKEERFDFFKKLNIDVTKLRLKPHSSKELAHYAKAAVDIEYEFPFGWQEIEGIHNRSDFDLIQHQKYSHKKLEYFDEQSSKKYTPFVIETAVGCDRLLLMVLVDAYKEETFELENGKTDSRTLFDLHPLLAPYQVALFPLSKKSTLSEKALALSDRISKHYSLDYDDRGSIGKRYRRHDEIGTPYCITFDFKSLEDQSVTVRDKQTMKQSRISIENLLPYLQDQFAKQDFVF